MLFLFCFTLAIGAEFNEKKRSRDFEPLEIDSITIKKQASEKSVTSHQRAIRNCV